MTVSIVRTKTTSGRRMRDSTDPARKLHKLCDTRHGQSNMHGLLFCFLRVTTDLMIVLFRVPPRQMQNCPCLLLKLFAWTIPLAWSCGKSRHLPSSAVDKVDQRLRSIGPVSSQLVGIAFDRRAVTIANLAICSALRNAIQKLQLGTAYILAEI